jgi:pilus assembly protein Flp/PilA
MPEARRWTRQCGASAVEYSLIVVAIAAIIVLVVFSVGALSQQQFTDTCNSLESGYTSVSASC